MLSDLKYQMSSSVVFQFMVELPNQLNICEIEGGAQNVIPLIVHITHFTVKKTNLTSGTKLNLIGWKIVPNESL